MVAVAHSTLCQQTVAISNCRNLLSTTQHRRNISPSILEEGGFFLRGGGGGGEVEDNMGRGEEEGGGGWGGGEERDGLMGQHGKSNSRRVNPIIS